MIITWQIVKQWHSNVKYSIMFIHCMTSLRWPPCLTPSASGMDLAEVWGGMRLVEGKRSQEKGN